MPFEKITMSDGAGIEVYRAVPTGARKAGLALIQEIFGLTHHITELCDGLADNGYEVLAPAIFDREHPGFRADYSGPDYQRGVQIARELHPFDLSLADAQTCIDALKPAGRVYITGYCYGGSVAWGIAGRDSGVAAASCYYGSLITTMFADQPPKCPTIVNLGRFDQSIPMNGVDALIAKGYPHATVYVYEAGHCFNSDRRKDYHEPSADLARERTLELFEAQL